MLSKIQFASFVRFSNPVLDAVKILYGLIYVEARNNTFEYSTSCLS